MRGGKQRPKKRNAEAGYSLITRDRRLGFIISFCAFALSSDAAVTLSEQGQIRLVVCPHESFRDRR